MRYLITDIRALLDRGGSLLDQDVVQDFVHPLYGKESMRKPRYENDLPGESALSAQRADSRAARQVVRAPSLLWKMCMDRGFQDAWASENCGRRHFAMV